jgi:TonB-linked SusC/RagA family outer membrane protein
MKKNHSLPCFFSNTGWKKFLLAMRISILLLTIGLQVNASAYSQNAKFSLNIKDQPLREVFKEIESKSQFHFFFGDNLLLLDKVVNANMENSNVEQILDQLLANSDYSYKVLENNLIVIAPDNFINRQSHKVTGTVTDATTGNSLPGVSIAVEGTTNGTITDASGKFTIEVPNKSAVLIFSFMGFLTEKVDVTDKTNINVDLTPDIKKLDEVVVVGYGTQKKVNLTGSVGTVQMDDLKDRPLTNSSLALQGTVSGVYALQSSGQPGSDNAVIDIRGVGSFTNNTPLILIDGLPGDMSNVNPNDIKSISVLKDAASASIYGNRAANGVILITTKRGTPGKMKVSYNGYFGTQKATRLPSVLNSVQYATLWNEADVNTGQAVKYSDADIAKFAAHNDPLYPDINYFDVYYNKASVQNHRFNISGGTENLQYAFMVGHLDQDGILVGTGFKKTDFRSNIDAYFLKDKKLRISANVAGSYGKQNQPTDLWNAEWYATLAPVHPLKDAAGHWMAVNGERNFYGEVKEGSTQINKTYDFSGQMEAEYKILKDLSAQVTYGYKADIYNNNAFHANVTLYNPDGSNIPLASNLRVTDGTNIETMLTSLLKYNKKFDKHEINVLAGYSEENYTYDWEDGYRANFVNNSQRVLNLGDAATWTNNSGSYDLGLRSYFGRLNYNFDGKYLLEGNLRKDGSSRFAPGHQWGTFPSVSVGWLVSKEAFLKNVSWMNMLKLRASWGQLGNEQIGEYYNGYDVLSSGQNYSLGGTLSSGVAVTKMTNKQLTWETSEQKNIGVDMALNMGIELSVDVFDKRTKHLLLPEPIPLTMGSLTVPWANAAEVQNKGIETSLTYRKTFANGIKLTTTLNASHIINKIKSMSVPEQLTSPKAYKIGAAINSFYGYKMDGIYQLSDFNYSGGVYTLKPGVVSVSNYNAQPGDIKYKDMNGDGVVDMTNDREIIGKQFPDLTYSLNFNVEWKGFDLGAFFQGVQGIQGYTYYEIATQFSGFANMGSWWMGRWMKDNPSNTYPRLTFDGVRNNIHSSFYVENASYLRLKNVELGYTVSPKLTSKIGISSIRIYGNIQNAFTITKFKGFDPEQTTDQTRAEAFPQVRIMTMGLNVNF